MAKPKYTVKAERDGRWWIVVGTGDLKGLFTQARSLEALEKRMLPDAIALLKGMPPDAFDVEVEVSVPGDLGAAVRELQQVRSQAETVQREASEALRKIVPPLLDRGFSVREAAHVLGVSHQRVAQLAKRPKLSGAPRSRSPKSAAR